MTIEFARNVMGLTGANSTEMDPDTPHPVIALMHDQRDVVDKGGTQRLGAYYAILEPDTRVHRAYGEPVVSERHRHRWELNAQLQAEARGGRPALQRHLAGPSPGRVHRARRIIRSGSARRPTPSSRAVPTVHIRCSASWSCAALGPPRVARAPHLFVVDEVQLRPSREPTLPSVSSSRRSGRPPGIHLARCGRHVRGTRRRAVRARRRSLARRGRRRAAVVRRTAMPTVVFVRQYRGPLDRLVLEIPAGMRDVAGRADSR